MICTAKIASSAIQNILAMVPQHQQRFLPQGQRGHRCQNLDQGLGSGVVRDLNGQFDLLLQVDPWLDCEVMDLLLHERRPMSLLHPKNSLLAVISLERNSLFRITPASRLSAEIAGKIRELR